MHAQAPSTLTARKQLSPPDACDFTKKYRAAREHENVHTVQHWPRRAVSVGLQRIVVTAAPLRCCQAAGCAAAQDHLRQ